ncbi:hypothetical protein [Saccharopolyspora sp. NPDC050642]|uniref:hypothetical protein n=1 Tax=Saccharopolyspora sp. NPDC050642 TaxID=3157099 RepID=UPI0033E7C4A3
MGPQWQWIGNLITAVATISGVFIGQVLTRRTERTKARREDATRWLQERRQAYADFLGAALARREVISYPAMYELGHPHHPSIDQRLKDLAMNHEVIYLIAPSDVIQRADQVRSALAALYDDSHRRIDMRGELPPELVTTGRNDSQVPMDMAVLEAVIEFRKAARRDLGIEAVPAEAAAVDAKRPSLEGTP